MDRGRYLHRRCLVRLDTRTTSIINIPPDSVFSSIVVTMLNHRCSGQRLVSSGFGLKLTREDDDYVALCEGGMLPLMVRPRERKREVVGDCYIHGIMSGEAYEVLKHNFKTMWFV